MRKLMPFVLLLLSSCTVMNTVKTNSREKHRIRDYEVLSVDTISYLDVYGKGIRTFWYYGGLSVDSLYSKRKDDYYHYEINIQSWPRICEVGDTMTVAPVRRFLYRDAVIIKTNKRDFIPIYR